MRITFLVGNGFDIKYGLQSSYTEFYENKLLDSECDNEIAVKIRDDYYSKKEENKESLWSNLEIALSKYEPDSNENPRSFLEALNIINGMLEEYLEEEESRVEATLDNDKIAKGFANTLLELFDDKALHRADRNALKTLRKNYRGSIQYSFINFNYTRTLDYCINCLIESGQVVSHVVDTGSYTDRVELPFHVHGCINDGIILGIDNKDQIAYEPWRDDPYINSLLIKVNNNLEWGETRTSTAERIINESGIIIVYGMSIGLTDLRWWQYIYKWLSANNSRYLILTSYSKKDGPPSSTISHFFMKTDFKNDFKEKVEIPNDDWENVKDRIIVCQNPEWFDIK